MLRIAEGTRCCDRVSVAALLTTALALAGCTGIGSSNVPTSATPPPSGSPSFTDRVTGFFSMSSANAPQPVAGGTPDLPCPYIKIREGASTLTIGPTDGNAAMSLKYQGTFVRAARECAVAAGQMVLRVGVEGRIIVGPAGGAGQVVVPLRIAVVDDRPAGSKTIVTKFIRIPVAVQSDTDSPTFTHIEEGLSFPLPPSGDLDSYIVYIGFDPLSEQAQEKHPEKPRRHRPTPKPTAHTD